MCPLAGRFSAALLLVVAPMACGQPRSGEPSTPLTADLGVEEPGQEPVRYPAGPLPAPLPPAEGIRAVVVPAIVRLPGVRYRPGGQPAPRDLRLGEETEPLGVGQAPATNAKLDPESGTAERIALEAAALRALDLESPHSEAKAAASGLAPLLVRRLPALRGPAAVPSPIETIRLPATREGDVDAEVPLADLLGPSERRSVLRSAVALHDSAADRMVVVALEIDAGAATPAGSSGRFHVAVSRDADPRGVWYTTVIEPIALTAGPGSANRFWGATLSDAALYLLIPELSHGDRSDVETASRTWAIEKGEASHGLYAGGPALVTVF